MSDLGKDIEALINTKSAENVSNTPDFILASFMTDCLAAFDRATNARTYWYGNQRSAPMSDTPKLLSAEELASIRQPVAKRAGQVTIIALLDHITALKGELQIANETGCYLQPFYKRALAAEAELARIRERLTDGKIAMLVADRIGFPCDQATPPCLGTCHCSNTARAIIAHITQEPKP